MNVEKFSMYDAVTGIEDIRHLVAIMFGTTDLLKIKQILNKSGYPFGSPQAFASQIKDVHKQWILNDGDIDKVRGYCGLTDPFDKVEAEINKLTIKEKQNAI